MKKTVLLSAFTLLSVCTVLAQDSTGTTTTKTHKKSMHSSTTHRNGTSGMDSVNAGKVTTNPHGKKKTHTSTSSSSSSATDSTK